MAVHIAIRFIGFGRVKAMRVVAGTVDRKGAISRTRAEGDRESLI
jgi:hypothetical protein